MTAEQLLYGLQQEYAHRREDNQQRYQERVEQVCRQCPGLADLLAARHAMVMDGVRQTLLTTQRRGGDMSRRMESINEEIAQRLRSAGLSVDALQPVYTCSLCHDEGYVYDPSRRMCDCFRPEYNRRLLVESGVGKNAASFDDFDLELFSEEVGQQGVSQRQMAGIIRKHCLAYADSFPQTETLNLLLTGQSGLGKTFMLQCIARRVADRGYLPKYTTANRLIQAARRAYLDNSDEQLNPFLQAALLLIDDLGTEPLMNNITVTQLFNLLNERQMAGLHTVISSNFSMSELKERYTERITSRFLDVTQWRHLTAIGDDIRPKLKRKEGKA